MGRASPGQSLSTPIIAPVVWSVHFMTCYTWAALACGRLATADRFGAARTGIVVVTAIAAVAIAACFVTGFRRHGRRLPDQSNDVGTPEDRTRFMAFMTMLLAALSLIATLFVGVAAAAMTRCS
jgi:hypothetical protein